MSTNDKKLQGAPWWVWLVLLAIVVGWMFNAKITKYLAFSLGGSEELGLNEIGDSFGSINALFSGVAMWGVIVTLILQSRELRQNTEEMKKSADALSKQVKISALTAQLNTLPELFKGCVEGIAYLLESAAIDKRNVSTQADAESTYRKTREFVEQELKRLGNAEVDESGTYCKLFNRDGAEVRMSKSKVDLEIEKWSEYKLVVEREFKELFELYEIRARNFKWLREVGS